jgi:hypothetical protein
MNRGILFIITWLLMLLCSNKQIASTSGSPDYISDHLFLRSLPLHDVIWAEYTLDSDAAVATIPLKRAGNLILMEAIIDSIHGNLILDTGSAAMVLNSIYFRQQAKMETVQAGGITGAAASVSRSGVAHMQLSQLSFSRVQCNIADLGHLERARNVKILGFFGLSLFANFEVVLDLQQNILHLYPINFRGNRMAGAEKAPRFDLVVPARVESSVIFIDGVINNRKLTFCLDTGAESNVISSNLSNNILATIDIHRRSTLKGATSQQVEVLYGTMNDFSIEKTSIPGMNTIITNLNAMSNFFGVRIDGMLGCDFLEKGIFHINLKKQQLGIIFRKEAHNE